MSVGEWLGNLEQIDNSRIAHLPQPYEGCTHSPPSQDTGFICACLGAQLSMFPLH